jgi:hypothetical protein
MKVWHVCQVAREAEIMTSLEEAKATYLESNPEETEAMAQHEKVINEEAAVELSEHWTGVWP